MKWSDLSKWDTLSAWLNVGFHVSHPQVPLHELFSVRWEQATDEQLVNGDVSMVDRVSFDGEVFAGAKQETRMEQFIAHPGDIVVSKIRARQGSVGVVQPQHGKVSVTIHYRVLIPDTAKIDTTYAWLALRSEYCRAQFLAATGGAMKGEISEEALLEIRLPFPPLTTQQAIVDRWRAAQAAADAIKQDAGAHEEGIRDLLQRELGTAHAPTHPKKKAFSLRWEEIDRWGVDMCRMSRNKPAVPKYPTARIKDICRMGSGGTPSRKIAIIL